MNFKSTILAFTFCALTFAQDITGNWQGTLQQPEGAALRIIMQVTKAADGLRAAIYNADQAVPPRNANSVSFQGSALKVAIVGMGASYEAKLSGEGKQLTGSWVQNGATRPLMFVRPTQDTAWAIPEAPAAPESMAANANASIEVATIRPSDPLATGGGITFDPAGLIRTRNTSVNDLLSTIFNVPVRQITGGPGWLATDRFDIVAKPDTPGVPTVDQARAMMQKLMVERFGLRFHREMRDGSGYLLTVAKSGPKLSVNQTGVALPGFGRSGPGVVNVRNATLDEVAQYFSTRMVDVPVVNKTGLAGKFDFVLQWRPDPTAAGPNAPSLPSEVEQRPDLFTAIQEQLGLKLDKAQVPVEMLVIDGVEKPSQN